MNRITIAGSGIVVLLGRKFGHAWLILGCLAGLVAACRSVEAATFTHNGGSGLSDNWGDNLNWDFFSIPPSDSTADVIFTGSGGISDMADAFDNDANWLIRSLTFSSTMTGAYSITGGGLGVNTSITNNDTTQQNFNNAAVNMLTTSLTIDANSGNIAFNTEVALLTSANTNLIVVGNHSVSFNGPITGSGVTSVDVGTLVLIGASTDGVDTWDISTGTLRLNGGSLAVLADVDVQSGGTFDLNGFGQNIGQLTGSGNVLTGGARSRPLARPSFRESSAKRAASPRSAPG